MADQLFETGDDDGRSRTPVPHADAPLAVRMRPRTIDELVGQQHILGSPQEPSALRRAIADGRPHSMVLYGPPGSGKTTLARIVAGAARAAFEELSAVEAGRAQVREVIERAAHRREASGEPTIFFLDEIHRFNKAQQDALLPAVEEGLVTLIGATTENPYFEVNAALLSRAQVYELHALSAADVEALLRRALERGECGGATVPGEVLAFLAGRSGGDARTALAALELACESAEGQPLTMEGAEEALQRRALRYDKAGDQHYDYISAFIKATRASDPDAALYYLAVMLEGGEDPRYLVRRMIVLASEDIGNADPQALVVATATAAAVEHIGMPECQYALGQCAIYLALAPKSNAATRAIGAARGHVRSHGAASPPAPLRSAAYPGAAELGRGQGYEYPHDQPGHVSGQEVAPDEVAGTRFYEPDDAEAPLRERLEQIRRARGR
ncbi:MAG: replication-associated recombination protein A [Solirubrobacterales bacterium]|nr:replication-associated recombination protein A [Solirubrobacterales bacterium]